MKTIKKQLLKEIKDTRTYILENEKALKELKKKEPEVLISGSIRSTTCRGVPQYYIHLPNKKNKYLAKSNLPSIQYAVKQEYHEKMATALIRREKALLSLRRCMKKCPLRKSRSSRQSYLPKKITYKNGWKSIPVIRTLTRKIVTTPRIAARKCVPNPKRFLLIYSTLIKFRINTNQC